MLNPLRKYGEPGNIILHLEVTDNWLVVRKMIKLQNVFNIIKCSLTLTFDIYLLEFFKLFVNIISVERYKMDPFCIVGLPLRDFKQTDFKMYIRLKNPRVAEKLR